MRRLTLVLLFSLTTMGCMFGQSRIYYPDSSLYYSTPIPKLAVKWIASQHVAHFPAHMLAVEHAVGEGLNLEHGLGLVYNREFAEDDPIYFDSKRGFKSFTKVKFFFEDPRSLTTYAGFEVFFNHFSFERTRTFELACGTDCSYFERRTFQMENSEIGFRLNAGLLSELTERLYLEAEMGIGLRNNNLTSNNRPPEFITIFGRIHPEEESVGNYAFNLNLKLAYRLK